MNKKRGIYHGKLAFYLLTFAMILGVLLNIDCGVLEVNAATDSGTWGDNITWEFADGTLTIRGNGPMQDCTLDGDGHYFTALVYPYGDRDKITKIVVDEGVTRIGEWNFYRWYPNVTTVILPDTLTDIGDYAFDSGGGSPSSPAYNKLKTVKMSNSLKKIGDSAFSHCARLENISFPDTLTEIGDFAFFHCDRLTGITIPGSVKTIGDTSFADCKNLSQIKISEGVSKIKQHAFSGCKKLTKVNIPSSVANIGKGVFWECTNLSKVTISNGVAKIGYMAFDTCKKLRTIDIPVSVSKIDCWAFSGCKNLSSIKIRNPRCKIIAGKSPACQNWETIPSKTTIYGYKGSTAQKYAKKFGCKFKSLSKNNKKGSNSSVSSKKK